MKIAFFEIHDWEKEILKKTFSKHKLLFSEKPLSKENAGEARDFDVISVFIYSKVNKDLIDRLGKIKMITTRSMGFDHIDLKECKKKGISVCNAPHYGDSAVAEHTFALILSLSRNIHKAYLRTSHDNFSIDGLKGFDLNGKTLGVIGTGRIGSNVIKIASGFGLKVLAYDVFKNSKLEKSLNFKYVSLDFLLKNSDIVSLHVPYMPSTHHLINNNTIKKIKPGALLINTSRGPIIDTRSLFEALNSGKLSGIGLDVIEGEELIKEEKELLHQKLNSDKLRQIVLDHKILHNEKVVFTPHIAFYSEEAIHNIITVTIENISSFIKNKPINLIR